MIHQVLMSHLADRLKSYTTNTKSKIVLLWHNGTIRSISVIKKNKRLCHISLGLLNLIHVNGKSFDICDYNSYDSIVDYIISQLSFRY